MPEPTPENLKLLNNVITELEKYKGEKILKGEHPLHTAVVRLERVCCDLSARTTIHPHRLYHPAHAIWVRLVWASRGDMISKPNHIRAKVLRTDLLVVLSKWRKEWPSECS